MILALIPARGGSKGIKHKNMHILHGNPLIFYTLQATKLSNSIDEVVVSSDSDMILEYVSKEGVKALKRPDILASDTSRSEEVVLHALECFSNANIVILLQPTSPLRTCSDIDKAFAIFRDKKLDSLISVTECDNKILKAFVETDNHTLRGICNNSYPFMPRQQLPATYISNGAIYIIKAEKFKQNPTFLSENNGYYVMSKKDSIDIDSIEDIRMVESIMSSS